MNDSETEKLIELKNFSGSKNENKENDEQNTEQVDPEVVQDAVGEDPLDEKARLIRDIEELNLTLEDLSQRIMINALEKSMKYFSHYYKEIQSTKAKFKDYIVRNDSETEKLIELKDFSGSKNEFVNQENKENEEKSSEQVDSEAVQDAVEEDPLDEKARLIRDIKELTLTLEDLTQKIVIVKTDTTKLSEENKVIDEYVVNLMEQTKTFEPTDF